MQPQGIHALLFSAFARITSRVFRADRLLSCPNLSKAPNYGDVLEKFIIKAPCNSLSFCQLLTLFFRYMASNGAHCLFLLVARIYIILLGWRLPASLFVSDKKIIVDSYAVLPRIAKSQCYEELYLPGLTQAITASGISHSQYYRLCGSRNPVVLWRAFKVLRDHGTGFTEAHLLRGADWLLLVWHLLAYPFSLWRLIHDLRAGARQNKRFASNSEADAGNSTEWAEGCSPERYICQGLLETAGQCIMHGEVARLAAKRLGHLVMATGQKCTVISWYENQTVNKAFFRGLRQSGGDIRILGAQLLVWPEALLNNHADDGEALLGLAPDKVLVNGAFFMPEASTQTYLVGPSLRYKALFGYPCCPFKKESSKRRESPEKVFLGPFLVLLSYHPDEIVRALELVLPLARQGHDVVYKFHPATNPDAYKTILPEYPILETGGLYEAVSKAGAVLGSGSGSLAEAAALGVPVLAVEAEQGLSLNYLPPFGEGKIWERVTRHSEILPAFERLRQAATQSGYAESIEKFRSMLFNDPTSEAIIDAFELCPNVSPSDPQKKEGD